LAYGLDENIVNWACRRTELDGDWPGVTSRRQRPEAAAGQSAVTRHIGAITKINNNVITLTTDSGGEILVTAGDATRSCAWRRARRISRTRTAATFQDLQTGDRILVGGELSGDAKSIIASTIV